MFKFQDILVGWLLRLDEKCMQLGIAVVQMIDMYVLHVSATSKEKKRDGDNCCED